MDRRPLVIDCDPGVDDAMAIMMLNGCGQFDIRGITAVHGNVPLKLTGANALGLAALMDIDCPVARGAEKALIRERARAEFAHGNSGLGDYKLPAHGKRFYTRPAWELLYETAMQCEGELELAVFGPLTNIAITVLKYPQFAQNIKCVYMMGGAAHAGNANDYAEFNVWQDPEAAAVVLEAGFKRLVMVDLDACISGSMTSDEADVMYELRSPVGVMLAELRRFRSKGWLDSDGISERMKKFYHNKFMPCDAVAAAVAIDDSIADIQQRYVVCECQSGPCVGQTIVDWEGRFDRMPNVDLVRSVNRERFRDLFFRCADFYERGTLR